MYNEIFNQNLSDDVKIMNKLSSLINNISQSNYRFLKKETAVTIKEFSSHDMDAASSIPFVDLIICPEYFAAYKKEALSYFGLDKEGYKRGGKYYPSKNWRGGNLREVFYKVSYEVDEILKGIRIKTLSTTDPYIDIAFSDNRYHPYLNVTTKLWNTFGRCYSIIPKSELQQLGIVSMIFEAKMDIYVYFGHPGQFLTANRNQKVTTHLNSNFLLQGYN